LVARGVLTVFLRTLWLVGLIKPGKETGLLELPYFYGHYGWWG